MTDVTIDDLPLRDDLRGRTPYGAPQLDVAVRLNTNENSFPVPETVAMAIVSSLAGQVRSLNRYPDRDFTVLRGKLAEYLGHGLTADNLWAANGSNEVLAQIVQAFGGPGRSAIGFTPSYSMHPIITTGTSTTWIEASRDDDFRIDADAAVRTVRDKRPDVVFLCSPNNPTGTALELDVVRDVYDASEGIVIVDEAYAEFARTGTPSALTLLPGRPRLLVSRTMSKAFALAGARLGYLAADPAVIDALRLVRLPYHLSALTQAAACAALDHAGELLDGVEALKEQRDRIVRELANLGLRAVPSDSNFVFFGGLRDSAATWQALLDHDVLVRDVGIDGFLRVSAGTEAETTKFLEALTTVLQEAPAQRKERS